MSPPSLDARRADAPPQPVAGRLGARVSAAARWRGAFVRLRPLSLVVLAVFVAGSLAMFAVSIHLVEEQERRSLSQRADEASALVSNSIGSVDSSLRVLGPIGVSSDPMAGALFTRSARPLLQGATATVAVAVSRSDGFSVRSAVGDGPAEGGALSGERAALATRALRENDLVSGLFRLAGQTRLALARPVPGSPAVVYQESIVDPSVPTHPGPDSPFRELRVALYASPRVDVDRLVLTTETEVPLTGRVERIPFPVGADRWLLGVGARESLVGSLPRMVPWLLLAGGLLTALLTTVLVETLSRRRGYALGLVADRTCQLEETVGELGQTRAFLELLLTAGPVVVIRIEPDGRRVTYASRNVERILGLPQDDVLARGFIERRIHPGDAPAFASAIERLAEGDHPDPEALEVRLRSGDGAYRWVSTTLAPEADGQGAAVLGYILDIDDRRGAERAQREAQEAAEAANRSKSQFLSRMSHELRTPLNAVLGFGQVLEMDPLTDAQRDSVEHILKGGRHLLDLINEVLDISRIEAGELSLSPEPVLAAELIRESVDLIRPLADQRGIRLVVGGSESCDCYLFADRQRLKQVLLNLLSNAVKYNRSRGAIAVSCDQASETRMQISVTDTGMGIPAERLGMLFAPFERLGAEHTGEEGVGIGLALSKRLAEAMGGTLSAVSTLGQGSTFTVELPRVEGPVERYQRLGGASHPAGASVAHHRVVLQIEDNLASVALVERILAQRPGVEVVAAMQGRLGLELAREHRPALILLDLHLPDMDGEQVLQRLRDDPATASIPVVIVSADATPGHAQRLLSAGALAYLPKPVDVRELLRLLDEAMEDR